MSLIYWLKRSLLPPAGFLGLAWLGAIAHWLLPAADWPAIVVVGGLLGIYLSGLPAVGFGLLRRLECHPPYDPAAGEPGARPGAIVVLDAGGSVRRDGRRVARPETLERLEHGVWQQRRSGLPLLVSGSGSAVAMAATLRESFGLEAGWVEQDSRTTHENAVLTATQLHPEGIDTIVLVTHAWHMPRARAAFRRAGFRVIEAPTGFASPPGWEMPLRLLVPTPAGWSACHMACHELVGLVWYRLRHGASPS